MSARALAGFGGLALVALALWFSVYGASSEEREIRRRVGALAAELNESTTDGLGALARAARLGQYFTPDVVVELGQGTPPIHGRETLIGTASRLQPRTAAFALELDDVNVEIVGDTRASLTLTVVVRRRAFTSDEESIDAREFSAEMQNTDGQWRISHVAAVDTLLR